VLELDVQVERNVGSVDAVALVVRAEVALLDLGGQPSILLAVLEPVETVVLVLQLLTQEDNTSI
jgi:hypothetical protein